MSGYRRSIAVFTMLSLLGLPQRSGGQPEPSPASSSRAEPSAGTQPSDGRDAALEAEAAETAAERARLREERERMRAQRIRLGVPITLIVAGAGATFAGGLFVFAANHGEADCDESCGGVSPMRAVAITVLVSGLAALAAGIGMTSVRLDARDRRVRELEQLDREIDALSGANQLLFTPWIELERGSRGARGGLAALMRF